MTPINTHIPLILPLRLTPSLPARLGFAVATLSPLVVVGLASAVTTLVNVEVGLVILRDMLSVVKTTDVVALGNRSEVEVRGWVESETDELVVVWFADVRGVLEAELSVRLGLMLVTAVPWRDEVVVRQEVELELSVRLTMVIVVVEWPSVLELVDALVVMNEVE